MPSQPRAQACRFRLAEEIGQFLLAVLKPRPAEVFAVVLDQIEGTEHGGMVVKPITEGIEYREAAFIDHDGLAVDMTGRRGNGT